MLKVELVDDPAAFLTRVTPYLVADEPRHNLMLAVAGTLVAHPQLYPEHRLWLASDDDGIAGAALRTPPWHVLLARPRDDAALAALAGAVDQDVSGVVGAVPEVHRFVELRGGSSRQAMAQGVYALERVEPIAAVSGRTRDANAADRALLLGWWHAFMRDALPDADVSRASTALDHRLSAADAGVVLWCDPEPVAFAAYGGPTPNGIRIGPVYTPPEHRGRGYATSLVAGLSQRLLDAGRRFCFLYTDLTNPTSNAIYVRIGYRLVCESVEVVFT